MLPLSAAYAIKKRNPRKMIYQNVNKIEGEEASMGAFKPKSIVQGIMSKRAPAEDLSDEAFMTNEEPEDNEDLFAEEEAPLDRTGAIRKILQGLRSR